MRVLHLAPPASEPGPLTAFSFVNEEIEALGRAGVECFVLSPTAAADRDDGPLHVRAVRPVGRGSALTSALGLLRGDADLLRGARSLAQLRDCLYPARLERAALEVVVRERIDVIHSHFGWPGGLGGALARRATGRPLLAALRGMDVLRDDRIGYGLRRNPAYARALRLLLRRADRTASVSDFVRREAIGLGAPPERARVVLKGVDTDRFRPAEDRAALRRELGVEGPMILAVGGLIRRKGLHTVLEAVARCPVPATLVVCGDGPERGALEARAAELGVAGRVRFAGRVGRESVARHFAACDVFVLASLVEASGNVLLEAMASARPVVCTASGGPAEYVRDGVTGFVVPPEDAAAMAHRLGRLLADPPLADALGRVGRAHAVRHLAYPRMIREITGLYEELAGAPAARARPASLALG